MAPDAAHLGHPLGRRTRLGGGRVSERTTLAMRVFWDDSARRRVASNHDWTVSLGAPEVDAYFESGHRIVRELVDRSPVPRGELGGGGDRQRPGTGVRGARRSLRPVVGMDISSEMVRRGLRARRSAQGLVPGQRRAAPPELQRRVGRPPKFPPPFSPPAPRPGPPPPPWGAGRGAGPPRAPPRWGGTPPPPRGGGPPPRASPPPRPPVAPAAAPPPPTPWRGGAPAGWERRPLFPGGAPGGFRSRPPPMDGMRFSRTGRGWTPRPTC